MLFKNIISVYGNSLNGKSAPSDDPVWHLGRSEGLRAFRHYVLDALQNAKVYLLDHRAADYTDTFHDTMLERDKAEAASVIKAFMNEVALPADVVWVEYDFGVLSTDRLKRDGADASLSATTGGAGERGFLLDNRRSDCLRVAMFRSDRSGKILDPFGVLRFERASTGEAILDEYHPERCNHMLEIMTRRGMGAAELKGTYEKHMAESSYDLFIPYALFAMLASPDLGGVTAADAVTFTPREERTARKFGKTWLTAAPRSHITVRIGPQAEAHMRERIARLEHERLARDARNGPVRHWVSEHERHYRSGKIVTIRGHQRGKEPDRHVPTRVMGPRGNPADVGGAKE